MPLNSLDTVYAQPCTMTKYPARPVFEPGTSMQARPDYKPPSACLWTVWTLYMHNHARWLISGQTGIRVWYLHVPPGYKPPSIRMSHRGRPAYRVGLYYVKTNCFNPLTAKLFNLNFRSLEVVSRWRDPQLQVNENYSDLTKWRATHFKSCWLMSLFILNMFKRRYIMC